MVFLKITLKCDQSTKKEMSYIKYAYVGFGENKQLCSVYPISTSLNSIVRWALSFRHLFFTCLRVIRSFLELPCNHNQFECILSFCSQYLATYSIKGKKMLVCSTKKKK